MSVNLNPEKALIFRIVHVANVPWILQHGMYCRSAANQDPNYINIGSTSLIDKRSRRVVPIPPGGTLSDYVPFYFTPFSIMMFNIQTGYGGITRRDKQDIVIFVSSIHRLRELGLSFVFTNQHAYPVDTDFYADIADLKHIDWALLQSRDFKTNDVDPGRQSRYQAEALVHGHLPLTAVLGIGCYNEAGQKQVEAAMPANGQKMSVKTRPTWYF
jgi:hypothetical protein